MKSRYFLIIIGLLAACTACGQKKSTNNTKQSKQPEQHIDQNFCNTLMGIVANVSSDFVDIRGKKGEAIGSAMRYTSLRGVTGVKTSSIIDDSGWRYEGIIYQGDSKTDLAGYYNEDAAHLDRCLPHSGYKLTQTENREKKLQEYPDLCYKYQTGIVAIELKVEYSEMNGIYTLVVIVKK